MKTMFKKGCMQTAAIFITVVMLTSIMKMPVVYAYFTAEARSEKLTFLIKATDKPDANVSFIDPFLFENEASQKETSLALRQNTMLLNTLGREALESLAGDDSENFAVKLSGPQRVQAEIRLEDGFDVADIHIPSVELHYGDSSVSALAGELDGADTLVVDFDREAIAPWFEGADEEMEYVTFTVTGEGYSGGLDRFLFAGEAELLFKGSYETRTIAITGPDGFFIPSSGETAEETYSLENQDETALEGAQWALQEPVAGVEIDADTGLLTIDSSAPEGVVTILALLESEGRILTAQKPVQLYAPPALAIYGVEIITIPPPQKTSIEEYRVEALSDVLLTEVNWELREAVAGVSVDDKGRVTVTGETTGEGFTLLARLQVEMEGLVLPLTLQQEVLLETIVVGAVEILGETQITIPDGGAQDYAYQAVVYDPEGVPLAGEAISWHLEGGTYGVSLDPAAGILTVENSAAAGSITVVATSERCAAISAGKTVNLEAPSRETVPVNPSPLPVVGKEYIVIEGPTLILIPFGEATKTCTYTAAGTQGTPMDNVHFALLAEYNGVTLRESGELTVDSSAVEGSIVLLAVLQGGEGEEGPPLSGELIVNLAFPAPAAVHIEGSSNITIPVSADAGTPEVVNYSAKVLDQEGNPIEGAEVIWSLAEAVGGVSLSDAGELTVTSGASAGSVIIIATSVSNGEVSGSYEVELLQETETEISTEPTTEPSNGNGGENGNGENPSGKEEETPDLEDPPADGEGGGDDTPAGEGDGQSSDGGDITDPVDEVKDTTLGASTGSLQGGSAGGDNGNTGNPLGSAQEQDPQAINPAPPVIRDDELGPKDPEE